MEVLTAVFATLLVLAGVGTLVLAFRPSTPAVYSDEWMLGIGAGAVLAGMFVLTVLAVAE